MEKPNEVEGARLQKKVSPEEKIIDRAGKRNLEETLALLQSVEAVLNGEQKRGEGRIRNAETIGDIDSKKGKTDVIHFTKGGVGFHKINQGLLICASDTHGDFAALSSALREFKKRKEAGEEAYFNFSGDFYTLDSTKDGLPQIEALLAAKAKYPQAVFWETGNADRAHISFFVGMGTEIVRRYISEDTYAQMEKEAKNAMNDFCFKQYGSSFDDIDSEMAGDEMSEEEKKQKYPKFAAVKKFGKIFFENAIFLQEARACGADLMDARDFPAKFIYQKLSDILIVEGQNEEGTQKEEKSRLSLMRHLGRSLVGATQFHKTERKTDADPAKIRQAFDVYKKIAGVINRMPVINIVNIPSQNKNIVLSHSWPVGMEKISQLVYDPVRQREAAWNKFFEDQEGKKEGKKNEYAYGPDTLKKWFAKNNIALGQFGHNHGNRINDLGEGMFRLEVATTARAKNGLLNEPAFAVVNIAKIFELERGNWQNVIEFKKA